ncbi:histidinol-phosphate aminotransferase, partial [Candidatus Omnitrophus magneticus]
MNKLFYKTNLEKIVPYIPGKPIEEVKREMGLKSAVKLASNENPLGPSKCVLKAIETAAKGVNRYPDGGCFYLGNAVAGKLGVKRENIIFGNGSDEVIVFATRAFLVSLDEVIIASPTFLVYNLASLLEGAIVKSVPIKNFKYDLDAMAGAVTAKTKIIFLANPDNPTGSYISKKELEKFIEKIPKGVILFIDEAYYEFALGQDYPETLSLINREDKDIIIARTFSKAYGLAGLRIGYGLARPELITILNKVREPFNVNSIAQGAAIAALEDTAYVKKSVKLVSEEKERYYKFFDSLKIEYIKSKTNFILFRAGRKSIEIYKTLLSKGVITREMSHWGLEGFLRVT